MGAWCLHYQEGWGGPCNLDDVLAVIFAIIAALVIIAQSRRYRLLISKPSGTSQATLSNILCLISYTAIAIAPYVWLLACLAAERRLVAGFQIFSETILLASWIPVLVLLGLSFHNRVTLSFKFLAWPAVVVYAVKIYSSVRILISHEETAAMGAALLVITVGQVVLLLLASILEALRRPSKDEEDSLKEALLGGDVESPPQKQSRSWLSLLATAVIYVWPDELLMQLRVAACVIIVALVRVLNLAVPILYRNAVNKLAEVSDATHPRHGPKEAFSFMNVFYPAILLYMIAAFLQGGPAVSMGLLNNIRTFLFIRVSQDAYRRISVELFSHTLHLDLKFHLMRKTGEITRQLDRGTAAIQNVLSTVVFNIGPSIFDIVAASVYVAASLNAWVALIVFVTMASYIPITIWLTEWRGGLRRNMNKTDNVKAARCTDALLNYETVMYFSNEDLEVRRYAEAVGDYQAVEWKLLASLSALNIVQSVIVWLGLGSGLIVCVKGAAQGTLTVGDTVLFLTIMQQLYGPLNYFGSYYRAIQQYMIDMENMFELFDKRPSIQDAPDAKALAGPKGASVEFSDVTFAFVTGSPVLENVSFKAEPGQTIALVGPTGSGKSTIVRLVYRLYDPLTGSISLNSQNLPSLQQKSMREIMAMVPQDVVLFNDTIEYNIRYGRPEASREEVEAAAEAACLHEAITERFPQQYNTIVGERGLRLSGGEKQRVGVARAILKQPGLLLMDEATSALDSLTEQKIQKALTEFPCTRLIVAHRLSTIKDADQIVVLKEGKVQQIGNHFQLMETGGLYAEMWMRQAQSTEDGLTPNASHKSLPTLQIADAGMTPNASHKSLPGLQNGH